MDLAVLQDLGIFESRDKPNNARLFRIAKMVLETDEAVSIGHQVLLPQLHACIGLLSCFWVRQTFRLHRAVSQSIDAPAGELFKGQAGFEPLRVFEALHRNRFGIDQFIIKNAVLFRRERAVYIIVTAFAVTCRLERYRHIDRIGRDDRSDRVVKI